MNIRNKILVTFFSILSIIGIYLYSNPILLKFIFSSSRNLGQPIPAKIYTDGKLNERIKLFKVYSHFDKKRANFEILVFSDDVSRNFISINYDYNFIGLPNSTNEKDYKILLGNLFQSNLGATFFPINDKIKGYGFEPELKFNTKSTTFKLPKNEFGYDSIRIEK
ncbi:hypothetical protein [Empedobacter brevis]|uniref:hypothetical protein n=1 Tax=Empedobacter brevis TaxID=247 RepID=UPI00289E78D9|nr:hypothetical protein [Empedobacter brevis]